MLKKRTVRSGGKTRQRRQISGNTAIAAEAGGQSRHMSRVPGLDGVRALAVLAVIAFHVGMRMTPGGFLGVDVFFVLSGYLITDLLIARHARCGRLGLRGFWVRRARRLLPALAALLVAVTAAVAVTEPDQLPVLRPALAAAATYSSNWYQALHHVSYFASFGPPPPLQHLWSLAIEEQFYLAWPLMLLLVLTLLRGRRARMLTAWLAALASAAAMALIFAPGGDPSRVYYGTDTHATGLLVGAALALTWPMATLTSASREFARRLDYLGVAGLVVLGWAVGHFSGADPAVYPFGLAAVALAAAGLTAAAAAPGLVSALLSLPPLRWLGVRSYGIYLWHWPVIAIAAAITGGRPAAPWLWPAEAAVAITLAAASWAWLEEPILRNGFAATCAAFCRALAHSARTAWRSPVRALPVLWAAAALTVACTAGYGVFHPPSGMSAMEIQILRGERVGEATQARASRPAAAPAAQAPASPTRRAVVGRQVTAIGDSVMAAGAMALHDVLPGIYIDALASRQMPAGLDVVRGLADSGRLRPVVVVGLGTNYIVTTGELRQLMRLLGPHRTLVLINTYVPDQWSKQVNATLAAFVGRHPDVVLADWFDTIRYRTYLLWPDDIHPQLPGTRVYARMVYRAVQATRDVPSAAPAGWPATAGPATVTPVGSRLAERPQLAIWRARGKGLPDELQRVTGRPPGPVRYLLPARHPGRRDDRVLAFGPDGGKEPQFADAHGQVVVLRLEAERAGHAAAPGVHLGDVGAGDAAEQGHRRGRARERLLVAVAVEHDAAATDGAALRQGDPAVGDGFQDQLLRQPGGGRHGPRSRIAGKQGQVLVAQG
jgi:peptidoglycan/LPS O-acetylase OafA/YrhL